MAEDASLTDEGQAIHYSAQVNNAEECALDEDPFVHSASLQQVARRILEPLVPMLSEDSAPFFREHCVAILLGVIIFLILLLSAIMQLFLKTFKHKIVVLYGPMEAGKTSLLYTLQGIKVPNGTVSSMKPNEAVVNVPGSSKPVKVIDIPGHPRLRSVYELHAASAACIVFLLDSSTFAAVKQAVAEQLYHVLQRQAQHGRSGAAVVVACNKADLEERAFSQEFILKQLEREINSFRASKCADVPGAAASQAGLGPVSVPFTFATSTAHVRFCTMSVAKSQLQDLFAAMGTL